MRRSLVVGSGVILFAMVVTFAVGQQQPVESGAARIFSVSPSGNSSVLVDTRTGKTWLLNHPADSLRPATWLPVAKIDDFDQAANWKSVDRARAIKISENRDDTRRLNDLKSQFADITSRSTQAGNHPALEQLTKQIAELEAKIKANQ